MTLTARSVTLASFNLCSCSGFTQRQAHLTVSIKEADLRTTSAVAISYAWGEFDRRKYDLGHWGDSAEQPLSFELGAEWTLTSFILRVVQLTKTHGGVWIDQACLPQDVSDDLWADILMSIPLVFKTLPVIALLPGRLCTCLNTAYQQFQEAVQDAQRNPANTSDAVEEAYDMLEDIVMGVECVSANGWCSWADRIWTSEELRYSSQISVVWAEEEFVSCTPMSRWNPALKPEQLTGSRLLLYRAMQSAGRSHDEIMAEIRRRDSRWVQALCQAICDSVQDYASPTSMSIFEDRKSKYVARFLLGGVLQFGDGTTALSNLGRFVCACEILAQTSRQATKPYDYVFSVWADWPGYRVPSPFSHLTCFELLADALDQLGSSEAAVFIPSSSPAGLCNSSLSSWKYICDLSASAGKVIDTRDVYRPFFWQNAMTMIGSVVTLHIEHDAPRLSKLRLVEDWIRQLSPDKVLEQILAFKFCADRKFVAEVERTGQSHVIHDPFSLLGKRRLGTDDIFEYICLSLNLDLRKCRGVGLQPMCVRRQMTAYRGSSREASANVTCFGLANWEKLKDAERCGRRAVSVNITDEKWPFYEAVSLREGDDRFSVAGVWVPLENVWECPLECIIDNVGINGVLV